MQFYAKNALFHKKWPFGWKSGFGRKSEIWVKIYDFLILDQNLSMLPLYLQRFVQSGENVKSWRILWKIFPAREIFSGILYFSWCSLIFYFSGKITPRSCSWCGFIDRGPGQNAAGASFCEILWKLRNFTKFRDFDIFTKNHTFCTFAANPL